MNAVRVLAVAKRHWWVLKRSPHRSFDIILWPIVDTLTFGSLAIAYQSNQTRAFYVLAGVVLWHVIYQAQIAVSAGFLEETWSRNLLSLMVSPVTEAEYLMGTGLFGMVKTLLGVGGVALTALICYAFDITSLGIGLIPVAALLLVSGWVIAMLVIGIVLRYGSGAEALVWGILFVLMPLSGTFFPVAALPSALQPVAQALPTTHAFTAARQLVDGGAFPWHELTISALLTVVTGLAAMFYVTSMLRLFRRRGYVTRYS
ncbi:MAG: type transport system permease protein [Actinomycetota bacterium]|jgi:ABC-2 type transport system permease protein|nr:type transport system permease protein [Actinomycetota bacterium]